MKKRFEPVKSPHLVPTNGSFRVADVATKPPKNRRDDDENEAALSKGIERMGKLQARLMANDQRSLLVIFQAMDAAGKDGTVKAVMTGVNPAGVETSNFKRPSELELDHDFLWRCMRCLPQRGHIGIWNRSHYEEVLVVKVHPEILESQRLPDRPKLSVLFDERYQSIREFEQHLARNGTRIIKFWLHVGRAEQRKRFLDRIEDPAANWKFEAGDVKERQHWKAYMSAYERALRETSRPWAPWYAVPADDKRYMRRVVAEVIAETLDSMNLEYPVLSAANKAEMLKARALLESE